MQAQQPKLTVEEAEALRSGWLMQSAVGKVSPAMRRYFGAEKPEEASSSERDHA